jgi:hypothetical protein
MLSFTPSSYKHLLAPLVLFSILLLFLLFGPIAQLDHYHDFADQRKLWGIPNALDVVTNLAYFFVALYGCFHFAKKMHGPSKLQMRDAAYAMLILSLFATAIASSYYHLYPDDARLFWDRLPIALACASLILAIRLETKYCHTDQAHYFKFRLEIGLTLIGAIAGVAWWKISGDLRWYLALQAIVILCIPIWQTVYACTKLQRYSLIGVIVLYAVAKLFESTDHFIFHQLSFISGHSLKHLVSAAAAFLILWQWQKQST